MVSACQWGIEYCCSSRCENGNVVKYCSQSVCQACQKCNDCQNCNVTCDSAQTECKLIGQTPNTVGALKRNNTDNYNQYTKIDDTDINAIYSWITQIKNRYNSYNGNKPFTTWNGNAVTDKNIIDSDDYNAPASQVGQSSKSAGDTILSSTFSALWSAIGNYTFAANLCVNCNTSCQGCNNCNSCNSGQNYTCTQCVTCYSSCQSCQSCNSLCNNVGLTNL